MSAIIKSEMISRRKALSLMGLAAAFGLAAPTLLTVSDAEAQTAAAPTAVAPTAGMERRAARHERRMERRQHGTSGVWSGAQHGTSGVWTGAQEQIPLQVQLPVQLQLPAPVPGRKSNSTGSARPRAIYLGDDDPRLRRHWLHGLSAESKSALLAA